MVDSQKGYLQEIYVKFANSFVCALRKKKNIFKRYTSSSLIVLSVLRENFRGRVGWGGGVVALIADVPLELISPKTLFIRNCCILSQLFLETMTCERMSLRSIWKGKGQNKISNLLNLSSEIDHKYSLKKVTCGPRSLWKVQGD